MRSVFIGLIGGLSTVALTGCGGSSAVAEIFQARQLPPEASEKLAAMTFGQTPITVRGRITMAHFAVPGSTGMITVQTDSDRYVFLTARTRDLAKQGFSRFSVSPGQELIVTGVAAKGGERMENFIAARADAIAAVDGKTLFNRADLAQ